MNGEALKAMPASSKPAPEGREFYGKLLTYRPGNHRYFWGGEPIPSVTTIVGLLNKPMLIQWAANMAVDHMEAWFRTKGTPEQFGVVCAEARKAHTVKKETAADIGTRVHDYAQACLKANHLLPLPDDPEAMKALEGFQDWFRSHSIQTIEVERMICSAHHHYAGRCDFFGRINGHLGVLDIKTSKDVYPEAWLQLAGYQVALHEELRMEDPTMRWVLHLSKETGKAKLHARPTSTPITMAWAALVAHHKYMKAAEKIEKAIAEAA